MREAAGYFVRARGEIGSAVAFLRGEHTGTQSHFSVRLAVPNPMGFKFRIGSSVPLGAIWDHPDDRVKVFNPVIDNAYYLSANTPTTLVELVKCHPLRELMILQETLFLSMRPRGGGLLFKQLPPGIDQLELSTFAPRLEDWSWVVPFYDMFREVVPKLITLVLPRNPVARVEFVLKHIRASPAGTGVTVWDGARFRLAELRALTENVQPALLGLLELAIFDEDPNISREAIAAVGRTEGSPAASMLIECLGFIAHHEPTLFPAVREALAEHDLFVWAQEFQRALGGQPEAVAVLQRCPHRDELLAALEYVVIGGAPDLAAYAAWTLAGLGAFTSRPVVDRRALNPSVLSVDARTRFHQAQEMFQQYEDLPRPAPGPSAEKALPRPVGADEAVRDELPRSVDPESDS